MRSCAIWNAGALLGLATLSWFTSCEPKGKGEPSKERIITEKSASVSASPKVPRATAEDMVATLDELLIQLEPCGKLTCATFADPTSALNLLLDAHPRILAVGEAHVLKGGEDVVSSTERFETQFLPDLAKRGTSELVVELLKPAPQCEKPVEQVEKKEQQVTARQAPENKNRFVSLGVSARKLDIVPYLLEPDCAAYHSIAEAGDESVLRMLQVIRDETVRRVTKFYRRQEERRAQGESPSLVVTYGGALHNDVDVDPEKAKFAFGRELVETSGGRYLELDLIVPEFIRDDEVWRKLPWYDSFDHVHPKKEATLIRTGPRSFVLVFGHGATAAPPKADSALPQPG